MIEVLCARDKDWERVRALRLAALASEPDAFASTLEGERTHPPVWWRERLESDRAATLLARADGEDAGLAIIARLGDGNDAALYAVWVAPSARGRGVGDALVEAAVSLARERGHDRLVLEVGDHNALAIALYARHGFEPTGNSTTLPAPREHVTEHERAKVL